jgi:hypothetical protein
MELAETFASDMIAAYKTGRIEDYFEYLDEQDGAFFDEFGDDIDEAIEILTSSTPLTEDEDTDSSDLYDWDDMTEGLRMFLKDRATAVNDIIHAKRNKQLGHGTTGLGLLTQKKELASARREIVRDAKSKIHEARGLKNRFSLMKASRKENKDAKKDMRKAKHDEFKKRLAGEDSSKEKEAADKATRKYQAVINKNGYFGVKGEHNAVSALVKSKKQEISDTKAREQKVRSELDTAAHGPSEEQQKAEKDKIEARGKEALQNKEQNKEAYAEHKAKAEENIQKNKEAHDRKSDIITGFHKMRDSGDVSSPKPAETLKPKTEVSAQSSGKTEQTDEKSKTKVEDLELDYYLYDILDENGYMTSKKNLKDLKEGLSTGKYILIDTSSSNLDEDMSLTESASLLELLDHNEYEPSTENLNAIKKMISDNRVLFY